MGRTAKKFSMKSSRQKRASKQASLNFRMSFLSEDERREFFGGCAKVLVPLVLRSTPAPPTPFNNIPELSAFQAGFNKISANNISSPTIQIQQLLSEMRRTSGMSVGKQRPRDISKRFYRLRSKAKRTLISTQTSKPVRGLRIFFESIRPLVLGFAGEMHSQKVTLQNNNVVDAS